MVVLVVVCGVCQRAAMMADQWMNETGVLQDKTFTDVRFGDVLW